MFMWGLEVEEECIIISALVFGISYANELELQQS